MRIIHLFLAVLVLACSFAAPAQTPNLARWSEVREDARAEIFSARQKFCRAGNFLELKSCLKNNTYIVLTSNIILEPGQFLAIKDMHNVVIDGRDKKFGFDETAARFTSATHVSERLEYRDGVYISIDNSSNIVLRNMSFASSPSHTMGGCVNGEPKHLEDACRAAVWVRDGHNVRILNNVFNARKKFQLHIIGVNGFVVQGNVLTGAATYGLAIGPREMGNRNGRIRSNTFTRAGANGIIAGDLDNVIIEKNMFHSNHLFTQFYGYGGGQLDITTRTQRRATQNVRIVHNQIIAGESPHSHGLEFTNLESTLNANYPVRNIEVAHNYIEGNIHRGIKFERFTSKSVGRNILIHHNTLKDNIAPGISAMALANHPVTATDNTLIVSKLGYQAVHSFMPVNSCKVNQNGVCSVNITWGVKSNTQRPVIITVRYFDKIGGADVRKVFASSNANGTFTQEAPWITLRPVVFEMYDASDYATRRDIMWETPLAQMVVSGQ